MVNLKFNFVKCVNDVLNNIGIEERTIDITYFNIKIICKDFELRCSIDKDGENKILTKKINYEIIIAINALLMMIVEYFSYVMELSLKGGDVNEV